MEFLPIIFDLAKYYAFFCLVTAVCFALINFRYAIAIRPNWGVFPHLAFVTTIFISAFVLAPIFFVILMGYSEVYKAAIIVALEKEDNE
jgi:amino acid permease